MKNLNELMSLSREIGIPVDRVVREEIQKLILRYLAERRFFSGGVFQGGTAIRLFYQGARFSEDLDFVFREKDHALFSGLSPVLRDLPGFLRKQVPFSGDVELAKQKGSGLLVRFKLKLQVPEKGSRLVINLEFASVPSLQPQVRLLRVDPVDVPVAVEDENEILADKVVAIALREFVKGRDLWDIDFLIRTRNVSLPDPNLILAKAKAYGCAPVEFLDRLGRRIPLLQEEGLAALDAEMRRFLPRQLMEDLVSSFPELLARVIGAVQSVWARMEKAT